MDGMNLEPGVAKRIAFWGLRCARRCMAVNGGILKEGIRFCEKREGVWCPIEEAERMRKSTVRN